MGMHLANQRTGRQTKKARRDTAGSETEGTEHVRSRKDRVMKHDRCIMCRAAHNAHAPGGLL